MKKMNLANKITVFRILLIPVLLFIFLFPYAQYGVEIPRLQLSTVALPYTNLLGAIVFVVASITDFVDGYIARKNNLVTTFGKFLDPIADKLLVNSVLLIFVANGTLPVIIPIIMIGRDMIVDGVRLMASQKQVVLAASFLGKAKTSIQMLAITLMLLNNLPFELLHLPMADILMWLATGISIVSGVEYVLQNKHILFETM